MSTEAPATPLESLRIYFKGSYGIDPPTANNNDIDAIIDVDTVTLTNFWNGLPDEEVRKSLMSLERQRRAPGQPPTQALPSYWNYFGTNGFWFKDVTVSGITLAGDVGVEQVEDPLLVGAPVTLLGSGGRRAQMFQINSTDTISAQVIADQLVLGSQGCKAIGASLTRAHQRWMYFFRNPSLPLPPSRGSAIFQTIIRPEHLDLDDAQGSQGLSLLAQARQQGLGLSVLYCLYFTSPPPLSPEELARRFAAGEYVHNPKAGRVVGIIRPWRPGELESMPPGRLLQPPRVPPFGTTQPQPLGPALVQVDYARSLIELNLISTIPETGESLEKVDLGDLELRVVNGTTNTLVARLRYGQYDRAAYEATSGMVPLSFRGRPELEPLLRSGLLRLTASTPGGYGPNPVLQESEYTLVADDANVYLDFGQKKQVTVRVHRLGVPAAQVPVQVGIWRNILSDPGARAKQHEQPEAGLPPLTTFAEANIRLPVDEATTNEAGEVSFAVEPRSAGAACLYFWVPEAQRMPQPVVAPFSGMLNLFYANVRVLPEDAQLDAVEPTWDAVYQNVLRYYYLIYPGMNAFVPLNDEQKVREQAPYILASIDPKLWGSTRFMPVSRDMSAARRRLLTRWLLLSQPPASP